MDANWDKWRSAGYLVNRAARRFARMVDTRLKWLGMSAGQIPVFMALSGGEELSQKALVEMAEIEQPTMAATLARMERDELVERRPDPQDGRGSLVRLTPAAMKRRGEVTTAITQGNAQALAGFTPAEQELFLGMLRRVIENLESD